MRVYLEAARFLDGVSEPGDLAVERIFIHVTDVSECWVETESLMVPRAGRIASFFVPASLQLGFQRIVGTVERCVDKGTKVRVVQIPLTEPSEISAE